MGFLPENIQNYLENNYQEDMTGADLARELSLAGRTARRYIANYKAAITCAAPQRVRFPVETMDAVVFDIETTDFGTEGHSGWLICCSFLSLATGTVETLEATFGTKSNDIALLKQVAKKLSQYSFHIGHNIAAYDYNWLNSRLMFHGLPCLDSAYYFDTYQVAKSLAIKTRKSLGNLVDYFDLEGIKTTIFRTSWSRVSSPYETDFEAGLAEIVEHCELDVEANRRLFDVIHWNSKNNGRACAWKSSKSRGNYWSNVKEEKEITP